MRILLATDGSSCSDAAIAEISRRPWPPQSEVRLITVTAPIEANAFVGTSMAVLDQLVEVQRDEAIRLCSAAKAIFEKNAPELLVSSVVREGLPKDIILDEAQQWRPDLLVVGSRGKGTILRPLGSVSSAIAAHAPCSVEVVRIPTGPPSESTVRPA